MTLMIYLINTNIRQQVLERENGFSDMTEWEDLSYYNVIKNNIEKCDYYLEEKFKSEISSRFSEKSHFPLFNSSKCEKLVKQSGWSASVFNRT